MSDPAAWVSAIAASVSTVGVLGAGGFAYFRFYRTRVHHANLDINIAAGLHEFANSSSMASRITVKNTGSFRMHIGRDCLYQLTVERLDSAIWKDAQEHGDILWSEGRVAVVDLMEEEGVRDLGIYLEPGQPTDQSIVLPLPRGAFAYKLTVLVQARVDALGRRKQEPGGWRAHSIVISRSSDERPAGALPGEGGAVVEVPSLRRFRLFGRWHRPALPQPPQRRLAGRPDAGTTTTD